MRLLSAQNIQQDMILGKSIYTVHNKLLLGAGFRISPDIKTKLLERGYSQVYIMENGTEDVIPEDIISEEIRIQAQSVIADKADKIQRYFRFRDISRTKIYELLNSGYLKDMNITYDMRKIVNEIFHDISSVGATTLNSALFKAENSYYMDHSINTTVISILLGKKYGFTKAEMLNLGVGAFLHDFGKVVIEKIRENSNPDVADELSREHPTFGYLLVRNSKSSSPMVSQIINQHHENQDGSGFPIGLKGENLPPTSTAKRKTKGTIYRLAEICSVANAYDNLVMNPKDSQQKSPEEAIKELILKVGTIYNKHIVSMLTDIIPVFPVGATIHVKEIVDPALIGYTGVVAQINPKHLNKPVIILLYDRTMKHIKPRMIDTSKLKHVKLDLVL
ncbi:HD domain-containing protein [bacterium]|nr:HD domain-containing protein [bacterium]